MTLAWLPCPVCTQALRKGHSTSCTHESRRAVDGCDLYILCEAVSLPLAQSEAGLPIDSGVSWLLALLLPAERLDLEGFGSLFPVEAMHVLGPRLNPKDFVN